MCLCVFVCMQVSCLVKCYSLWSIRSPIRVTTALWINPRLASYPHHPPPDSCNSLLGPLSSCSPPRLLVFFDVSTPTLFLPDDSSSSAPRVRLAYTTRVYYSRVLLAYTPRLLLKDPRKRSSATDLLRHPFLAECTIATDTERADMTPEGSETVRSSYRCRVRIMIRIKQM